MPGHKAVFWVAAAFKDWVLLRRRSSAQTTAEVLLGGKEASGTLMFSLSFCWLLVTTEADRRRRRGFEGSAALAHRITRVTVTFQLSKSLTPWDVLLSLIAAATHDLDHPGVNQPFLIKTNHYLATLYKVSTARVVRVSPVWRMLRSAEKERRLVVGLGVGLNPNVVSVSLFLKKA